MNTGAQRLPWIGVLFALASGFVLFENWQWSILMDDVNYNHILVGHGLLSELHNPDLNYWGGGRLWPVKHLANLILWNWLPPSAVAVHRLLLVVATIGVGLGARIANNIARSAPSGTSVRTLGLALGLYILSKPVLESIALASIGETWVSLFLMIGLYFWSEGQHPWIARISFLLSALSKEPAIIAFLCCALAEASTWVKWGEPHPDRKVRRNYRELAIDLSVLTVLAILVRHSMIVGNYLGGYSIIRPVALQSLAYSIGRNFLPFIPILGLLLTESGRRELSQILETEKSRRLMVFLGTYFCGYLILVSPRGTSGYLSVPASTVLWLAILVWVNRVVLSPIKPIVEWAVLVGSLYMGFFCLSKWTSYVSAIDQASIEVNSLAQSFTPRIVYMNAVEASNQASAVVHDFNSATRFLDISHAGEDLSQFHGEVVVLEFTRYFGELSPHSLEAIRRQVGEWKFTYQDATLKKWVGYR